jgi:hypothetical protein
LTLFFKGKLTQTALATSIELSNITSSVQLPKSFDGLLNIISKKANLPKYDKNWYCGFCLICIPEKNFPAFQRECSVSDSRYFIIANYTKTFLK